MLLLSFAAIAAVASWPPPIATPRDFGSFLAACDNRRTCGILSKGGDGLVIRRAAGANAPVHVTVAGADWVRGAKRYSLDGTEITSVMSNSKSWSGAEGLDLARRLAAGRTLQVTRVGNFSLDGLADALRWIDRQQRRNGGVTAFLETGPAPATRVARAITAPVIVAPRRTDTYPEPLPAAEDRRLRAQWGCPARDERYIATTRMERLDRTTSLLLVGCSRLAQDQYVAYLVVDGKRSPLPLDVPVPGLRPGATRINWNEQFERLQIRLGPTDPDSQRCTAAYDYAWDGRRFRLANARVVNDCRVDRGDLLLWSATVRASGR